ncbi:hypothetical protein BC834DRAFT_374649 [Gloeopeniophorella convolvens]|nr:hypothetical protein BC834DRAFT_374649 [Gloeopeniophorella convolvens]
MELIEGKMRSGRSCGNARDSTLPTPATLPAQCACRKCTAERHDAVTKRRTGEVITRHHGICDRAVQQGGVTSLDALVDGPGPPATTHPSAGGRGAGARGGERQKLLCSIHTSQLFHGARLAFPRGFQARQSDESQSVHPNILRAMRAGRWSPSHSLYYVSPTLPAVPES